MSNSTEQDQTASAGALSAANGNQTDAKKIEVINFKSNDKLCCFNVKTNHTKVFGSGGTHARGSSKVKLKNVVDYKWEHKYYYPGHLVAVHRDGKHLAYAINVNNKATGMEGMVRVCNTSTSQRALIKGMSGEVLDLQFAHSERERILAVIDVNTLFVYKIDLIDGNLMCKLILRIDDPIANYVPKYDLVSWCPYISNSRDANINAASGNQEDEDENQLLIWSRSNQFQCFHVKMIITEHGIGQIQPTALDAGYLMIKEDALITCAALSPDGTTVAAACADGLVRFYQIYLFDVRNHRCLHEWKPHDGKPVDSLFFLDNINKPVEDAYWQYVITTSEHNTEIKLWNCTLWECLQTINLVAAVQPGMFIAGIDRSANYLVLSSLGSLAVYVLQINGGVLAGKLDEQASDSGESDNGNAAADSDNANNECSVRIQNVAEFKLSSGILSFSIVNACMRRLRNTNESYFAVEEPDDDYDDENNSTTNALVVHMFVVQAKSLQECQIIYQPSVPDKAERSLNSSLNTSSTTNTSIKRSLTPENEITPPRLLNVNELKQEPTSPQNSSSGSIAVPLDALFGKAKRNSLGTTTSTSVVAVAVAAAAAPSAILQDAAAENKSRSNSPQFGSSNFAQLNLMTPDAFSATTAASVLVATTTTSSSGNNTTNPTTAETANSAAPAAPLLLDRSCIDASVRETLRMLAMATGNAAAADAAKVNATVKKLMNSQRLEDHAYHKLQEQESRKKFVAIDSNPERNVAENLASDLMKTQSLQLNKLELEVGKLQQQQKQQHASSSSTKALQPKNVNELAYKIEMQLSKLMEQYLKRYENEHQKKLNEFLQVRETQNRELRESVVQVLNQYIMSHFTEIIGNVLNMELQRQLLPRVNAKMDQLQTVMQLEIMQKLTVFDKTIKENVAQVCKSKQFLDAFGKTVLIGVQNSLQTAFIESMSSTLIPAYEKSSQNMFKQLHEAFSVGIKDFMVEFNAYLQHMPQAQNSEELTDKMGLLKQLVEVKLNEQRSELTGAMLETQREVKSLEILLARQVQETIRAELRKHLVDTQALAMRSQAPTPAPTYDLRDSIKQLLAAGQINKAFHQALLANDLNLVEFTLRHTDRMQVFTNEGCRLEQKVLLSLIQQISADMSNHNELKQSYLNEAMLAINVSDPITREHAPKVLAELHRSCLQFIKNYPKSPQCSNVRLMIAMCSTISHSV
ncbi:Ge-1 [Drosophila busckii]|uniref:Ge-1 n=1 Tax=Drosophila busckii TaxID=30019 RepID=A0A0M4E0H0_DROBS|nr:Ge-1 [Drosophila busckii]